MGKKGSKRQPQGPLRRFAKQTLAFASIHVKEDKLNDLLDDEIKARDHKPTTSFQECRMKLKHVLHSRIMLAIVVFLCVMDCILVIGELILDMHAIKELADPEGHATHHDTNSTNAIKSLHYEVGSPNHGDIMVNPNTTRHRRATDNEGGHGAEHPHSLEMDIAHAFHYASITILAILVVETMFKIFCEGTAFLKKKVEVFDAFVVVVSFVLDLVFLEGITNKPLHESAYTLSFILPWRVIRVVNSLVVAVLDHEHFKLLLVYKSKKYFRKQLDERTEDMHVVRKQLHAVKALCVEAGTEEWIVNQTIVRVASQFGKKEKCALSSFASMTAGAVVNEKRSFLSGVRRKDKKQKFLDEEANGKVIDMHRVITSPMNGTMSSFSSVPNDDLPQS